MEESVLQFAKQLTYIPEIHNKEKLETYKHTILCGMGGSHLQAGIMKMYTPGIDLYVHRNYDLPPYDKEFMKDSLIIASSYSGNTEEVISSLETALTKGYSVAVITTGGVLLEKAKEHALPYIELPSTGIQPRSALGYTTIALAKMLGDEHCIMDMKDLKFTLHPDLLKKHGEELAEQLENKIPIIYSSVTNLPIAYNWKIKMNETGKVPAFYNVFPELNHNEMQGFGEQVGNEKLHIIFLKDRDDHPQIRKRMDIAEKLYEEQGYSATSLELKGEDMLHKIFSSLLLADWVAISLAKRRDVEPETVPMIEAFKSELNAAK